MRIRAVVLAVGACLVAQQAAAYCVVTNDGCMGAEGLLVEQEGYYVNPRTGERVMDIPESARIYGPQPGLRYCEVLRPGDVCRTERGAMLVERNRFYIDPADGWVAMTVPVPSVRPVRTRYVSGPLYAAEGIATPIGPVGRVEIDGETPQQAFDRRLGNAWSKSAREQVIREERERINREYQAAGGVVLPDDPPRRAAIPLSPTKAAPPEPPPKMEAPITNPWTGEMLMPAGGGSYIGTRDGRFYNPAGPGMLLDTRSGRFIMVQ